MDRPLPALPVMLAVALLFSAAVAEDVAKVEAFALEIEQAAVESDAGFFSERVDGRALVDRVLEELEIDGDDRAGFRQGFLQTFDGAQLLQGVLGQNYTYLGMRQVSGKERPLFRVVTEGGVNYHGVHSVRGKDGKLHIADLFIFATGEWSSESIRRIALPALASTNRSLIERLFGDGNEEYLAEMVKLREMENHILQGNPGKSVALYEALSTSIRDEKVVLLLYLTALGAMEGREEEYADGLGRFGKLFPGDAAAEFMLIDYYMLRGEWDAWFSSLTRLEEAVGGDPYLDVIRSGGMIYKKDWQAAGRYARRAIERDPYLEDAHWSLVNVAASTGDHQLVADELTVLRDTFGYIFARGDFGVPMYETFLESEPGRVFLAAGEEP